MKPTDDHSIQREDENRGAVSKSGEGSGRDESKNEVGKPTDEETLATGGNEPGQDFAAETIVGDETAPPVGPPEQREIDSEIIALETIALGNEPSTAPPVGVPDAPTEILTSLGDETPSIQITDTRESGSPQKFGNFELLGELGRGGMGVVYKARQLNPDRLVALKMILTGSFAASGFRRRFEIEAEAVGNLRHPNIVSLYESGELQGNLYYTMPLIDGITLSDSVENEVWEIRESVEMMKKLADAIAHAHQRGVLHRDLKPSNVLLDKQREPYITDFGLAKITDGSAGDVTMTGDVMGSPGYMAPEQALGRTHEISTATDVYGLGVIMYQVVTGHPPFRGETVAELLQHVIHTEPARPRSALGRVDRDISTICLRCMEKEPKAKYATAGELAEDLQRWLDGEPIKARAVGVAERTWKWMRRNPLMTAFLVVTVFLSSIAVIGIESQRRLYRDQRSKYLAQLLDAKMRHAEGELEKGYPGKALAHLADILSIDPDHRIARGRIVEQLRNGVFARALHSPIETGIKIRSPDSQLAVSPDRSTVFVANDDGAGWLVTESNTKEQLDLGRGELVNLGFSNGNDWLFASQLPEGVKVWSAKTGETLFTLPNTNDHAIIAIHPESSQIATIRTDHSPVLWNLADQTSRVLMWPKEPADRQRFPMRYDPTGRLVVACSAAQFAIWDSASGKLELAFDEPKARKRTECYAFSRDGKFFAWGGAMDIGRVWNLESEEMLAELSHGKTIASISFNHDGTLVATGGKDKRAVVWEAAGGKIIREFEHADNPIHVEFDESGRHLLTVALDNTIRIWDVAANRKHSERINFTSKIVVAGFSAPGQITVVCEDGRVHRLSISASQSSFKLPKYAVQIDFAPNSDELVVAGRDENDSGGFHWKPDAEGLTNRFVHPFYTSSAKFSLNGRHVCVNGFMDLVRIWTRNTKGEWPDQARLVKIVGNSPITAFSPDSSKLVIAEGTSKNPELNWRLSLWSLAEHVSASGGLAPIRTNYVVDGRRGEALVFSPDNKHFAFGTRGGVTLWSEDDPNPVLEFEDGRWSNWLEFSPDGKILAGALIDGVGMLWNVETGRRHGKVLIHNGHLNCIRFSPDGRLVVTSSNDKTAQVWEVATGDPLGAPVVHGDRITQVAFSPSGDRFATASYDGTVRVWDLATRQPLSAPMVHGARVMHLDFNHDGRLLATSSWNGEVRIWSMDDHDPELAAEQLIRMAEEIGRHRVTEDGRVVRIPW